MIRKNIMRLVPCLFISQAAISAEINDIKSLKDNPLLNSSSQQPQQTLRSLGNQSSRYSVKLHKESKDNHFNLHKTYQQYFDNLPVFGYRLSAHQNANGSLKYHGVWVSDIEKDLAKKPSLTNQYALQQQMMTQHTIGVDHNIIDKTITPIIFIKDDKAHYAYEMSFLSYPSLLTQKGDAQLPKRPYFIVDAQTGEILKQWDALATAEVGTGPGGNTKVGQYLYGIDYPFMDVTQNGDTCQLETDYVKTIDLDNGMVGAQAFEYECPENTYQSVNGAYSPLNDAHYYGTQVVKLYQDWFGILPLTFQLRLRVHYGNEFQNAFWDGFSMTFGDGKDFFYPLVDVNVTAHEVAHGFTEQNSNLVYSAQSGGINEAYSDMAGEAVEYFLNGKVDWLVGADITKMTPALRYFARPSLDTVSIDHADEYPADDSMDVHYSSGVYNRAFYLLSITEGWGIKKAFEVFTQANRFYWMPQATYNSAACGVIESAKDYGYNFYEVDAVFRMVGVTCGAEPLVDTDGDFLSDDWEVFYGLDINDASDALLDNDSDGLDNLTEFFARTNPLNADTDADELTDADEVNIYATNPNAADSDGDELTDMDEVNLYSTNPTSADTDNDLLTDAQELSLETNPLSADTDSDGMSDYAEVRFGLDALTSDAKLDSDGDGWTNLQEVEAGAHPQVITSKPMALSTETLDINAFTAGYIFDDGYLSERILVAAGDYFGQTIKGFLGFELPITETEYDYAELTFAYNSDFVVNPDTNPLLRFNLLEANYQGLMDEVKAVENAFDFFAGGTLAAQTIPNQAQFGTYQRLRLTNEALQEMVNKGGDTALLTMDFLADPSNSPLSLIALFTGYQFEYVNLTFVASNDEDNDGMDDDWEISFGLDPANAEDALTDADEDGLVALQEYIQSSSPADVDSDADGINDGKEFYDYDTLPNNADTDGDGMDDGYEINNELNPLVADGQSDKDEDGLSNLTEFEQGLAANVADTDGDGFNDSEDRYPLDPNRWEDASGSSSLFMLTLMLIMIGLRRKIR